MKFSEVLPALEAGRVARRTWWAPGSYIHFQGECLLSEHGKRWSGLGLRSTILADDWEVIEEPAKGPSEDELVAEIFDLRKDVARLTRELEEARAREEAFRNRVSEFAGEFGR